MNQIDEAFDAMDHAEIMRTRRKKTQMSFIKVENQVK
jgi:hypothetical protein